MDIEAFIEKKNAINDIVNNAVKEIEALGYNVTEETRSFDAQNGNADIMFKIE